MSEYLRVLVVHRQESMADHIKKQFIGAGWLVHLAHNGLDGLLTARKESFGLIFSTIDLPVITGIEMARGIRNFSFNTDTPIVFIPHSSIQDYGNILKKLKASIYTSSLDDLSTLTHMFDRSSANRDMRIEP